MSNEHQQQQQQQQTAAFDQTIQWEENPGFNEPAHNGINTSYISKVMSLMNNRFCYLKILNRLTDIKKYDKRLRPRYGEGGKL